MHTPSLEKIQRPENAKVAAAKRQVKDNLSLLAFID